MTSNNIIGYCIIIIISIIIFTTIFGYNYIIPQSNQNIIAHPEEINVINETQNIPQITLTTIPTTSPTIPIIVETPTPIIKISTTPIENNSITRNFKYILRGEQGIIPVQLYSDINSYIISNGTPVACWKDENDYTPCNHEENTSYYLKFIDDLSQMTTLDNLIASIQSKTTNKDDQARIAISLVQNIPYDKFKANSVIASGDVRFPYTVLYENTGICEEKSLLLAYLLRELGYGVVLFEFNLENHMTVGIKSPDQHSYKNTGYAFIESTSPFIITNSQGDYSDSGKLTSDPLIYQINKGNSMTSISEEYQDSSIYNQLGDRQALAPEAYRQWEILVWKYGLIMSDGTTINQNPSDEPLCDGNRLCNGACWNACNPGKHWICTSQGATCTY